MRLQLTVAALLLLVTAPAAEGADRVSLEPATRVALYKDSDQTTIWTSTTGVTGRLDERWEVGARYLVDVVSSASVDVVSQATGSFQDTRHDLSVSAGYRDDSQSLIGSYSYSTENDWQSHNASLSATQDLLQHNLTLSASAALQDNTITRANSLGFEAQFPAIVLTGARQTGKTTLLRALFPQHHYVSLDLPSAAELAERQPESVPGSAPCAAVGR